ncbi:hypothetical protein ABT366_38290, partial [Streptomyces lydicus]
APQSTPGRRRGGPAPRGYPDRSELARLLGDVDAARVELEDVVLPDGADAPAPPGGTVVLLAAPDAADPLAEVLRSRGWSVRRRPSARPTESR